MKLIASIFITLFIFNTANASCLKKYEQYVKNFKMTHVEARELRRDIEQAMKEEGLPNKVKLNNTAVMRWQKSLYFRAKELIREVEGKTQAMVEVRRLAKGLKVKERWVKRRVRRANKIKAFCPNGDGPADYNQIVFYLATELNR